MFGRSKVMAAAAVTLLMTALGGTARAATYVADVATGGTMPIARVKVVLWGAYTAGATITVATGATTQTVSVPAAGSTPFLLGTDVGKAFHSGNGIVVDLTLNSVVASATQLCTPASAAAGVKPYSFTVAGTVTSWSRAGYSATSEVNCTCATRRKGTGVTWQLAATPPGSELRIPVNVMAVLDESGSMRSPPQGGAGSSKWSLTSQAVGEFVTALNNESDVTDQMGLVFFDSTVHPFSNGGTPWFPKTGFAGITTEVDKATHPLGGSTAIGGGLQTALEQTNCTQPDPLADPVIILMSDGMQNTVPRVEDGTGGDLGKKVLSYASTCGVGAPKLVQPLTSVCIPILTVYVDLPAGTPAATLLQAIADQTAGLNASRAQLTTDPALAFGEQLVNMMKGSTVSLIAKSIGTVSSTEPAGDRITVDIDGTVKRVIAVMGWEPRQGLERALLFDTTSPEEGGNLSSRGPSRAATPATPATPPATTPKPKPKAKAKPIVLKTKALARAVGSINPAYYLVGGIDLPLATNTTTFNIRPYRTRPNVDGQLPEIPYHLFLYAVETKLEFIPRFVAGRHGTSQPLVLNLELGLDHKPLTGTAGNLEVSVDGPTGAIGTLLHDFKDPGGGTTPGESGETAADTKLNNLNKNAEAIGKTLPKSLGQAIAFKDLGRGQYQVLLNEPKVPGAYVFHLTLDVPGPGGNIHRIENVETQVEVLPTASQISVAKLPDQTYQVQVVPLDKYKNYLGPGFESQIQLQVPTGGGKVASVGDTNVDGSYSIHVVDVPPGADPSVALYVAGTEIAKGPLSHLGEPGSTGGGTGSGGTPGAGGTPGGGGSGGGGGTVSVSCCGTASSHTRMSPAFPIMGLSLLGLGLGARRGRKARRDSKN